MKKRALLSVSDKTGIVEFARQLEELGYEVVSTGGTARIAAGLGVHTFMKPVEVIEYDEEGLKALAARINAFAVSEDLPAHGECVLSRFVKDPYDKATLREQEKEAGLR